MDESTLDRVEEQRIRLEDSVAKLRRSLRHWQTLEIDYEGLKEEFQGLPDETPPEDCLKVAHDFKPELVDEKELASLLSNQNKEHRKPSQLVEILSKRAEYVLRNVDTIRNQITSAERKRNALLLAENPDHQDEAALPLQEISEVLDDDGNVLSHKIETPVKVAPDLLETLAKAGVKDLPQATTRAHETTSVASDTDEISSHNLLAHGGAAAEHLQDDKVDVNPQQHEDLELGPTNSEDNDEEAALRQEMLRYGMDEVGAIVAELDLEEELTDESYDTNDEFDEDFSDDDDVLSDQSEDDHGAVKNPMLSTKYLRRMEALQKKYGLEDVHNVGPALEPAEQGQTTEDRPPAAEAARKAAIARNEVVKSAMKSPTEETNTMKRTKSGKKKVVFASEVDVAPASLSKTTATEPTQSINPLAEKVVEKPTTNRSLALPDVLPPTPSPAKPPSRFKAMRTAGAQTTNYPPPLEPDTAASKKTTPTGPTDRLVAATLVERPASSQSRPTDPSDLNNELHRQEVAVEYQKLRNRRIHQQGGYVRGGEEENYGDELGPLVIEDEETGRSRKVSRFKAARLSQP